MSIVRPPQSIDPERVSVVNLMKDSLSASAYFLFVDLDNEGGKYPHIAGDHILIANFLACALKSNASDTWCARIGVVVAIDETEATIEYMEMGTLPLRDASVLRCESQHLVSVMNLSMKVTDGTLEHVLTNNVTTTSDLNTGTTIEDVAGDQRTPAVGDILLRIDKMSGSGTLTCQYQLWYGVV